MMMGDRNQTPTAAKRFADSFPYQMNQNVIWIRDLMCGSSLYGSKGTLEALADVLAHDVYNASDRGAKLLQSYYTLEMYFSYLLATQMKGAFIEANLRDYWDTEDGTEGSAAAYIQDKIIPMVEQEADYFLLAVEKLVISSADVRSPMASDYSMFPREAVQQVFERADFLAHQLSSRHPGGLVIRVIGDRQLVEQCLTAPKNETHFGTPDVITIPSDGDAVRNYTPYFPESLVSAGKYVAWEPVDSMKLYDDQPEVVEAIWKFYVNSKVAVARLSFPRQRYPFTDQHLRMAPFTRTYKFAHSLTTRVRYMRRSMKSGRELRSSSSDEVLFGHGVVFARFMPEFAHAQPEFLEASDDKFRYETDWNCTTGRIVEVVEVKKAYTGGGKKRGTWISHSRRPFMLCHIVNGDSSSRTLKLAYKGRIESKADGFKNATTDTHWDSSRDFEITLGTDCQIGEPAMSRIGWGANREFPTVDGLSRNRIFDCRTRSSSKTAQENLDNSTTQTWTSGQVFTIKHCLSIYNCVNAYAARTLPFTDDLSDKGSTVTTTLELDSLEFIPQ
jgi:hypothetical protein